MSLPGVILREIQRARAFAAEGWGDAVARARFVGGTGSGVPTSGAHLARDFVVDTARLHICSASGTPGTWVSTATKAEFDALEVRVDDLEADVAGLQADVASLSGAIGSLESRVSALESA